MGLASALEPSSCSDAERALDFIVGAHGLLLTHPLFLSFWLRSGGGLLLRTRIGGGQLWRSAGRLQLSAAARQLRLSQSGVLL